MVWSTLIYVWEKREKAGNARLTGLSRHHVGDIIRQVVIIE